MQQLRQILDYLPVHLQNVYDIYDILNIQQSEIDLLFEKRYKILNNFFIDTADDEGLAYYEKMFGIKPNPNLTTEDRRFILKAKIIDKRPVTIKFVREQIKNLCGEDGFEISVNNVTHIITVNLSLAKKEKSNAVKELLQTIIPANMKLVIQMSYNSYDDIGEYKYQELESYTMQEIREEVM